MPLRRDRLTSEVGPDASGSKPGIECTQMPEKSGMGAALSLPLLAGLTVGATACPKAGVAATAASVTANRRYRRCFMLSSLFHRKLSHKATPFACALVRGREDAVLRWLRRP